MANIIKKRTNDNPEICGGEPDGPPEKFYLGKSLRGVHLDKPQSIPVRINGFARYVDMGEDNEVPAEYLAVLEQSRSTAKVVNTAKYDPEHGGRPRRPDEQAEMRTEYLSDYEIRRHTPPQRPLEAPQDMQRKGPKPFRPPTPDVSGEAQKED